MNNKPDHTELLKGLQHCETYFLNVANGNPETEEYRCAEVSHSAAQAIRDLLSVIDEREWISVEDRLPEPDQFCSGGATINVLLYEKDAGQYAGFKMGKCWFDCAADVQVTEPTHWQPLPPPPEKDNR